MSQTCPTCGKPLDSTRAPVARIRGARVVTYCSLACADSTAAGTGLAAGSETRAPVVPEVKRAPPPVEKPEPPPIVRSVIEKRPDEARRISTERPVPVVPLRAETRPSRKGRAAFLVLLTILLGAGVAFVMLEVWPLGGSERSGAAAPRPVEAAPAASAPLPAEAPPAPATPAEPDREQLYDAAVTELGVLVKSKSPRVKRLAAQALARTGDPDALEELRTLFGEEQSQLGKIQIAYALARAGDAPARQSLREQLEVDRRDARLDAARSLVQLGDDSGRKALRAMLTVDSHRLGAAGLLARLKDPEGIKILRAEMTKKSSAENVMRAVVALGRAGEVDVQDQLRTIVYDRRYNVGAADALAALGDQAAVEPLTQQLALSAMRVQAALWLRRLGQKVDLAPLALALESGDEAGRVSAAEALLVLTGPEKLAERD